MTGCDVYFRILHDDTSGAMSYLLGDMDAGEAVLIDPRASDVPVLAAMLDEQRLRLRWLLRTHDHGSMNADDAAALGMLGAPCMEHRVHRTDDRVIVFGGEHLRVLRTPGHTGGCLSFFWRDRLFCGDLFAVGNCVHQPRPALPEALWDSATRHVFTLPTETLLFSAHAPQGRLVSSVLEQRRWHPWLAAPTRDEFLARVLSDRATDTACAA